MKARLQVLFVSGLFFCFFSTGFAAEIDIPGTGDGVAVLKTVAAVYMEKSGDTIRVPDSIGSSGGIIAAGTDKVEVARVARDIKEKEQRFGLNYKAVFTVPTVFFVNKSVTIKNLSASQILDIYSGKITNWSQVGGQDAAINVICREAKDSSYNNLKKLFPGFNDLVLSEKAKTAFKTHHMVNIVLYEENAIGFGPLDVALENGLKVVSVNGKQPTDAGYPYFGTIGLVYKTETLSPEARKFLEFITSAEAKASIVKAGGVALK